MASTHPRRLKRTVTPLDTASLRKSGTFHSPTSVSSDLCDPVKDVAFMPKRSHTSTQSLEDLVNDAGPNRLHKLLVNVEKTLRGQNTNTVAFNASILNDQEVLPVPSFMLEHTALDDVMEIDSKPVIVDHQHASDSGLGSSVTGSRRGSTRSSARRSVQSSATSCHSAVTRSHSAMGAGAGKSGLSKHAIERIDKLILQPILAEPALKDFHDLIKDVPHRIGSKNISNLRDLEKTLIFLAPEYSATPASYQQFCETSISFIVTTVEHLNEPDQRLPTDRPYTNGYFLDLVEQIRRYAAIMAATREKEEAGEELNEMDYTPGEKITLRGGLSNNGAPAQLVREKDGKVIPIAPNGPDDEAAITYSSKRALSEEDDEVDEFGVYRSMARRRKGERPGDIMHTCRDCKKEFKRPCDLTKHEKTHSRPWKCPIASCKYNDLGWPTEKEKDRHYLDKHEGTPPQFKCLFPPCTYTSKRESNCKQHMEKAHGWEYKRSKSNGKNKAGSVSGKTPQTPATPLIATPASGFGHLSTPATPFQSSPSVPLFGDFNSFPNYMNSAPMAGMPMQNDWRRDSITTPGTAAMTYSSSHSPDQLNSFEAITPDDLTFDHGLTLDTNMNTNYSLAGLQQPTPALSGGYDDFNFAESSNQQYRFDPEPRISPTGQADLTLLGSQPEDNLHIDEGFGDDLSNFRPTHDFALFDAPSTTSGPAVSTTDMWANDFTGMDHTTSNMDTFFPTMTDTQYDDMLSGYNS